MQQWVHTRPMSEDDQDDVISVDGVDPSPRGHSQGPDILVSRKLVNIQFGGSGPRMLREVLERLIEPTLHSTGEPLKALTSNWVGEFQGEHSA